MAKQDVTEAFGILLSELDAALKEAREKAAQTSRHGKYQQAQTLLIQAQQVERFIADI